MKKALLFIFIVITSMMQAQVWCTPNSVWHYNTSIPAFNSAYTRQTYLYDTLVGTDTYNKLKLERHSFSMSGQQYNLSYFYTHVQNNVVLFNSDRSIISAVDTLLYFGPVGAKWRIQPNGGASCAQSYIEITGAGTSTVQGQPLAWRKVNYMNYYMFGNQNQQLQTGTDTIFERIGYKHIAFQLLGHCSEHPDVTTGQFRCFEDNQLSIQSGTLACNYTTGITENNLTIISIYPNPANSTLTITDDQNSFKNSVIDIKNALGQTVLSLPFTNQVNISQLQSGVYFLSINNRYKKFMKE